MPAENTRTPGSALITATRAASHASSKADISCPIMALFIEFNLSLRRNTMVATPRWISQLTRSLEVSTSAILGWVPRPGVQHRWSPGWLLPGRRASRSPITRAVAPSIRV